MANNPIHALMLASAKQLLAAIEDEPDGLFQQSRRWRTCGLCENIKHGAGLAILDTRSGASYDRLAQAFETWPHFSGMYAYPVPDPDVDAEDGEDSPQEIYNNTYDMYAGDYGAMRIDLLKHCIAKWESEQ